MRGIIGETVFSNIISRYAGRRRNYDGNRGSQINIVFWGKTGVNKQDACYTGITRDAGADSFIPTVCFAD